MKHHDLCFFSVTFNLFGAKFFFSSCPSSLAQNIESWIESVARSVVLQRLDLDWICQNRENIKPLQRRKHGTFVISGVNLV